MRAPAPLPHRIELVGLDGSNLLAFLASLGTLRLLTVPRVEVRMSWTDKRGFWMPVLHHSRLSGPEEVAAELGPLLCSPVRPPNPAFAVGPDLTLTPLEFAEHARNAALASSPSAREWADFLAAFGSEACPAGHKSAFIQDSALRTMSGAGHQHFIGFMQELSTSTEPQHVVRALFAPWDYSDDKPSMRWDPNDFRPYALRASDPAKDPIKTVRGANRLAVEALPFFVTAPASALLRTVGFDSRAVVITWPLWTEALDCDTVRGLLSLAELHHEVLDPAALTPRGIPQAFRSRRFTEGKYRNFSPAREML